MPRNSPTRSNSLTQATTQVIEKGLKYGLRSASTGASDLATAQVMEKGLKYGLRSASRGASEAEVMTVVKASIVMTGECVWVVWLWIGVECWKVRCCISEWTGCTCLYIPQIHLGQAIEDHCSKKRLIVQRLMLSASLLFQREQKGGHQAGEEAAYCLVVIGSLALMHNKRVY